HWRKQSFAQRADIIEGIGQRLLADKHRYAAIITQEMGKPIQAALTEIEKCAWVAQHYAQHAEDYLQARTVTTDYQKSYVSYQPLGVVLAIMPWNYPFWQVFRYAMPTLMAGNATVLKHAPISTGAALAMEALFADSGLPQHLFRVIVVDNADAKVAIEHPLVAGITLTGSGRAGRAVGQLAAGQLKKVVLELGGSDPYVILSDADLEQAAQACVQSRMNNAGQVCIAAKRVITVPEIRQAFQQNVLAKLAAYQMGDPMQMETNLGPLARADLRQTVHRQVQQSVAAGATLMQGGQLPEGIGFYYPPTVLTNVTAQMPAYDEEIFGPVISFIDADDEAHAIQLANDSAYGLSAAVFTNDLVKGERIARDELQAGVCVVNHYVSSDPRLPFGGIKQSGYGRELSAEGIHEFTNVKTVCVRAC
ncbi:MAG: aldehyde dehydrogenase family protein, partial [Legionellales bacterium]|nr:aldehyde dehydrogenase family protein [Legionellales bacterium]